MKKLTYLAAALAACLLLSVSIPALEETEALPAGEAAAPEEETAFLPAGETADLPEPPEEEEEPSVPEDPEPPDWRSGRTARFWYGRTCPARR